MTTHPINIANTLKYIYLGIVKGHEISYIPPDGGFVNNDQNEFNRIVFNDSFYGPPSWSDILLYNDGAYEWCILQDVITNWSVVKGSQTPTAITNPIGCIIPITQVNIFSLGHGWVPPSVGDVIGIGSFQNQYLPQIPNSTWVYLGQISTVFYLWLRKS